MASGKKGPVGHTRACRSRMEAAIQDADPARWERYLLKRGDVPGEPEGDGTGLGPAPSGEPAAIEDVPRSPAAMDEDEDGWEGLWESDDERASAVQRADRRVQFQPVEVIVVPN